MCRNQHRLRGIWRGIYIRSRRTELDLVKIDKMTNGLLLIDSLRLVVLSLVMPCTGDGVFSSILAANHPKGTR